MDKELYRFYSKFTKDVNKQVEKWLEQYEDLSFSKKIELERLLNIDNEVRSLLKQPAIDIGKTINNRVVSEGNAGYNSVYHSLETEHNIDLDFHFLDKKYLEKLANNKVAGKTLSQRLYKQRTQLAQRTTDAIARGMMFGYGYDRMALEIRTVSEASYNQAIRIARTESGRVRSITTQQAYSEAKNKGVELKKQWMSTSDGRTREDHSTLNGQVVEVDEDFTIGNYKAQGPRMFGVAREDINCRCTTVSVVNGIAPSLERSDDDFYQKKYDDWLKEQGKKNDIIKEKELDYFKPNNISRSLKDSIDDLKQVHGITFNNARLKKHKIDPQLLSESLDFINYFKDKFPDFMNLNPNKLPEITMLPPSKIGKFTNAYYQFYQSVESVLDGRVNNKAIGIFLNSSRFNSYVDSYLKSKESVAIGWHSNFVSANHTFVHEYGHYISDSLGLMNKNANWQDIFIKKVYLKYTGNKNFSMMDYKKWQNTELKTILSRYGATNNSETFAEAFAEAYGSDKPSEFALTFRKELEKEIKKVI